MTLSYGSQSLKSAIHVAVVKGSDYPSALQVSFGLSKGGPYSPTLDVTPSQGGSSDIYVNFTLSCSNDLCTQAKGLALPKDYTLVVTTSSGTYTQTANLSLQLLKAKWLVMLYAEADTVPVIEDTTLYNLEEMINVSRSTPNPAVGILVLLKLAMAAPSTQTFTNGDETVLWSFKRPAEALWGVPTIPGDTTQLYQIVNGKIKQIGEDWTYITDQNLSDYRTLHKFLNTSMDMIPADRNQLIVDDHGGGIQGVAWDYSMGEKPMTIPSMTLALRGVAPKLEVLSFDACLMAQVEVLYNLRNYANFFTASERTVPGMGYAFDQFLARLSQNPSMSTVDYLKTIVSSYGARYDGTIRIEGELSRENATLAAIDSSKLQAVATSMDQLSHTLIDAYGTKSIDFNNTMDGISRMPGERMSLHMWMYSTLRADCSRT
jgi:hypothetical protein